MFLDSGSHVAHNCIPLNFKISCYCIWSQSVKGALLLFCLLNNILLLQTVAQNDDNKRMRTPMYDGNDDYGSYAGTEWWFIWWEQWII